MDFTLSKDDIRLCSKTVDIFPHDLVNPWHVYRTESKTFLYSFDILKSVAKKIFWLINRMFELLKRLLKGYFD